jgi:hypothetical protein
LGSAEITRPREIVFGERGLRLHKESAHAEFGEELRCAQEALGLAGEIG